MQIKSIVAGVAAGAVLATGGAFAIEAVTDQADAQGGSAGIQEQLRINQRVSQGSVIKSNAALEALKSQIPPGKTFGLKEKANQKVVPGTGTGWQTESYGAEQLTTGKASGGLQNYWAKGYYNGAQTQWSGRGVTAQNGVVRTAQGVYQVNWNMDISGCSYTVTPAYYAGGTPQKYAIAQVYPGANNQQAIVQTYNVNQNGAQNVDAQDYPWQAQVVCGAQTATGTQ